MAVNAAILSGWEFTRAVTTPGEDEWEDEAMRWKPNLVDEEFARWEKILGRRLQ